MENILWEHDDFWKDYKTDDKGEKGPAEICRADDL